MKSEEESGIGNLLSRIISSDIFKAVIVLMILFLLLIVVKEQYEKTLFLPFLFIYTIAELVEEHTLQFLFCAFIYVWIKNYVTLAGDDHKSNFFKMFSVGYFILCFCIIAGQTIRMNDSYELHNNRLTTAQILCYQVLDMTGNDSVTFYAEPCRTKRDMISHFTFSKVGRRHRIKRKTETYDYLCLDNQGDMIPIPSGYVREIDELLEENEGVCDITCYKYTHLIKSINGVELKDLEK